MSVPHTDTSARKNTVLVIHDAVPADYPAIHDVGVACAAGSARPKQGNARTRRASSPAYYLGRPAAFWLTALAR